MAWWIEEEPKKRLIGVYLLAYGDVFTLEQLHKSLHTPKGRKLAEELFHLLLDHLLVDDFPKAGVPPEVTEKLKEMIERAKAGIPEMVEILERGETPTGKEAYEKYLTGADGFLWGRIIDATDSEGRAKDILRRAGYHIPEKVRTTIFACEKCGYRKELKGDWKIGEKQSWYCPLCGETTTFVCQEIWG